MLLNRRISQTISLLLLHSSWGPEAKWLCNPVLSCHSCVLAWFACPIGVFVHYSGYHMFPFLAMGTVLLVGVLLGRLLCGWVCPFGFLMDLLYKVPSPKITLPKWTSGIKYVVLVGTVFLTPYFFGELTQFSFCRGCPAATIQATIPAQIQSGFSSVTTGTWVKLGILAGVLVLGVLSSRSFCKVFCPIGALLAPLNFFSFWFVKSPARTCTSCGRCDLYCPTDVHPSIRIAQDIPPNRASDCVVCHDCQKTCPHAAAQEL